MKPTSFWSHRLVSAGFIRTMMILLAWFLWANLEKITHYDEGGGVFLSIGKVIHTENYSIVMAKPKRYESRKGKYFSCLPNQFSLATPDQPTTIGLVLSATETGEKGRFIWHSRTVAKNSMKEYARKWLHIRRINSRLLMEDSWQYSWATNTLQKLRNSKWRNKGIKF